MRQTVWVIFLATLIGGCSSSKSSDDASVVDTVKEVGSDTSDDITPDVVGEFVPDTSTDVASDLIDDAIASDALVDECHFDHECPAEKSYCATDGLVGYCGACRGPSGCPAQEECVFGLCAKLSCVDGAMEGCYQKECKRERDAFVICVEEHGCVGDVIDPICKVKNCASENHAYRLCLTNDCPALQSC